MKQTSRHQDELYNTPALIDAFYPEVEVHSSKHGTYRLEGRILSKDVSQKPAIIVVHGARADYTKADDLMIPLHAMGLDILSATTSGHGVAGHKSTQPFSLNDNLREATAFADLLTQSGRTAIGFSMGGTTAARLVQENPELYDKLILFYPAVFNDEVYKVPFGTDEFRAKTSEKGSFLSSSFFECIHTFPGKIMLIKGEYDGLDPASFGKPDQNTVTTIMIGDREVYSPIPPEVFSKIMAIRPDSEYIELPGADHRFAKWFLDHPDDAKLITQKLFDFITG